MSRQRVYVVAYCAAMLLLAGVLGVLFYGHGRREAGWDWYTGDIAGEPVGFYQGSNRGADIDYASPLVALCDAKGCQVAAGVGCFCKAGTYHPTFPCWIKGRTSGPPTGKMLAVCDWDQAPLPQTRTHSLLGISRGESP